MTDTLSETEFLTLQQHLTTDAETPRKTIEARRFIVAHAFASGYSVAVRQAREIAALYE